MSICYSPTCGNYNIEPSHEHGTPCTNSCKVCHGIPAFSRASQGQHIERTPWFTEERRRWLYGIATPLLVLLGTYFGISAIEQENWLSLIGAILNITLAGATETARRNVN